MKTVHARAPCRICDIGGWTDTRFAEYGAVFSIAVWPGVEVTLNGDSMGMHTHQRSEKVARKLMDVSDPMLIGYDFAMPYGSGTGTSAAYGVALIAALDKWRGGNLSRHGIAQMAHRIETEELGLECGVQDQFASAYGGVNLIEIGSYPDGVAVKGLPMRRALLDRLLLVHIGTSHNSSEVHKKVIERIANPYELRLRTLRQCAGDAEHHYMAGDMPRFGYVMKLNTGMQRALHHSTTDIFNPLIKDLKDIGAAGWKVNGAGGGGTITIMADGVENRDRIESLIAEGYPQCRIIPITVADEGVETWGDG